MTQDHPSYPLRPAPAPVHPVYYDPPPMQADEEEPQTSPFKLLRRALHGRYLATGLLCVVLGAAGGIAGWKGPTPVYKAWGMVDVKPTQARILYATENNVLPPMYKEMVGSIVYKVKANEVVTRALKSDEWKALNRPPIDPNVAINQFKEQVEAVSSPKSTIVAVSYIDPDPKAAMVGTNALLNAFMAEQNSKTLTDGVSVTEILERRRESLANKIEALEASVFAFSNEKGAQAVFVEYDNLVMRRTRIQQRIDELEAEIASLEAAIKHGASTVGKVDPKTADQIAIVDPKMAQMLDSLSSMRTQRDVLIAQGYGRRDPKVMTLDADILSMEERVAKYAETYNATQGGSVDLRQATLDARRDELAWMQIQKTTCEKSLEDVGRTKRRIEQLQNEILLQKQRLDDVKYRLQTLDVESEVDDRISISEANLPTSPFNDKRFAIATGGGLAGFLLGFGIMVAIGLSNQRVRNIVDMDEDPKGNRFMGILPDLPGPDADPDEKGIAEHCIHNIRTMLQLNNRHRGAVTVVTSATASAGKTTLSAALGLSFAATGGRTLLVDADLVGRGLTSSIKALLRQRILRLLEEGDLDGGRRFEGADDLLSVLRDAQKRGENAEPLGMDELFDRARRFHDLTGERAAEIQRLLQVLQGQEVARERRGGASTGDIRRIILAGSGVDARSAGILEALCGAPLRDCVVRTGVPNLHVLTAGGADARDAGTLSPEAVMGLLNNATQEYDHVVLDTGPILGSLEASMLSAQADSVLLTVARGDERSLTVRALERLESVRAKVAGVVFNRADMGEVRRSNFSSQWRSDHVEIV